MMKKYFFIALLFCHISIFSIAIDCAASSIAEQIVSASEIDYPPYCHLNEKNQADGFSVELLRASLAEMGHDISYKTGPWSEVKQSLVDGDVQVLPLVGRTPERENDFDFTFPYLTRHGTIVVRETEGEITSLADLQGKTIAVMRGDNAEEFIRRIGLNVNLVTTVTFGEALKNLNEGEYDAVVIQKFLFQQLANEMGLNKLKSVGKPLEEFKQSFCFAVKEGNSQLLQILNEGLSIVFANGTFDQLYKKWIFHLEQKRHIKSRIIVGGDFNYPPYEYLDDNNQPAGYNVELTKAIAELKGLNVVIQLSPWGQIRDKLSTGQIDLVHGMFYSAERDKEYVFSPQHTKIVHVAVTREPLQPPEKLSDLDGKVVVVMSGDIMHDLLVERDKAKQVVIADSQEEVLALIASGRYDYALTAKIPALYWKEKNGWGSINIGVNAIVSPEYCFAAQHGNGELVELFTEGLVELKASGKYRDMYARTLGIYDKTDDPIYKYLFVVIAFLAILLSVALICLKTLQNLIKSKTLDLENELLLREELNRKIFEREKTINLILNSTEEGVYGVDENGCCLFFNAAAENLLGFNERELLGKNIHQRLQCENDDGTRSSNEKCLVEDVLETGTPCHNDDDVFSKKNGELLNVSYHIHPMMSHDNIQGAVVTFTNISERKRMLEQRIRSGQFSALGELAAGVAHEINNPINGMINYAQILLNRNIGNEEDQIILERIIKEGCRIGTIVRNLLGFAQKDPILMEMVAINIVIDESIQLLKAQLDNDGITTEIRIEDNLSKVFGNAQKIEQVILNCISNSRHALNEKYPTLHNDKKIEIAAESYGEGGDEQLRLTILDHGTGINSYNLTRIFNRFFTTKEAGVGTGLGLSIIQDILEEHSAIIEINSQFGKFTKVSIDFPICNRS